MDGTPQYHVVDIVGDTGGREMEAAAEKLKNMLQTRHAWVARSEIGRREATTTPCTHTEETRGWVEGPFGVPALRESFLEPFERLFKQYLTDLEIVREISHDGSCRTASRTRLEILERKFSIFHILNQDLEKQLEDDVDEQTSFLDHKQSAFLAPECASARETHKTVDETSSFSFPPIVKVDMFESVGADSVHQEYSQRTRPYSTECYASSEYPILLTLSKEGREGMPLKQFIQTLCLPFWLEGGCPLRRQIWDKAIGVSFTGLEVDEMPDITTKLTNDTPVGNIPDAILLFIVWYMLNAVNEKRCSDGKTPLSLTMKVKHRDHLIASFLLCKGVFNSAPLVKQQVLQYMFYLIKIAVISSPLHEGRAMAIACSDHPFRRFFTSGMLMTLESSRIRQVDQDSTKEMMTSDALFTYSQKGKGGGVHHIPLREELVATANIFALTKIDVVEMARNSHALFFHGLSEVCVSPYLAIRANFRRRAYNAEHLLLSTACTKVALQLGGIRYRHQMSYPVHAEKKNVESYIEHGRLEINGPKIFKKDFLGSAAERLRTVLLLRKKYEATERHWSKEMARTVAKISEGTKEFHLDVDDPCGISLSEFVADYHLICEVMSCSSVTALSKRRLEMLRNKYDIHTSLRKLEETGSDAVGRQTTLNDHRDFYQTIIVDTHVHMAAGMTARDLLEFIKNKATMQPDDIIGVQQMEKGTKVVTLDDVLRKLDIHSVSSLSVASLGVQADSTLFERFDNFNSKYSPLGKNDLRTLFLKSNSHFPTNTNDILGGRYFAEIIKKTFRRMAHNHFAEFRLSIYGKSMKEWEDLALWHSTHGMGSKKNKWLIQIPRIYSVLRKSGAVKNFGEQLKNVFQPLWAASIYPSRHPQIDHFLKYTSGFDSVDSEHGVDAAVDVNMVRPSQWNSTENPPYAYWMYYMYAHISALNQYRRSKNMSELSFRPHCGECGDPRHLASAFLTADGIAHGIQLRLSPTLQYLYYLTQLPIAVSPLSNNSLFLELEHSPFPDFFKRGLNVSLSTDDPLFFHQTQEPIVEEYSVASKLWRLSSTDLCEIARNSTRQSGFDNDVKERWGGPLFFLDSSVGNDERTTHVPDVRVAFRFEVYHDELFFLGRVREVDGHPKPEEMPRFLKTLEQEDTLLRNIGLDRKELLAQKVGLREVTLSKL